MDDDTRIPPRRRVDPMKLMEAIVALLFLLILVLVVAGLVPLSHPRVTSKVVSVIKGSGIDSCSIGRVSITLWKGVSLHDVAGEAALADGRRMTVKAERISLSCNCVMVALNLKKIRRMILKEYPDLRTMAQKDRFRALPPILQTLRKTGYFSEASMARARITLHNGSGGRISGNTVTLDVNLPDSRGSFSVGTLLVNRVVVARQLQGDLFLEKNLLRLPDCRGRVLEGKMKLATAIDLKRKHIAAFSLTLANADLSLALPAEDSARGLLRGTAEVKLELDAGPFSSDSLRGKGKLDVSRLEMANFPLQRRLVNMLLFPGFSHLRFEKFKSDLTLNPGWLVETNAQGDGDSISVSAKGWVRLDGTVNENIECVFSPAYFKTLSQIAQSTLEPTEDGGARFRCRIYGSVENPKVEIAGLRMIQKAVRTMFDNVKGNLMKWLQ